MKIFNIRQKKGITESKKGYKYYLGIGDSIECETDIISFEDSDKYVIIASYVFFNYSIKPYIKSGLEIWINNLHFGYLEPTIKDDMWVENDIIIYYKCMEKEYKEKTDIVTTYGLAYLKIPTKYLKVNEKANILIKTFQDTEEPWGYMVISEENIKKGEIKEKDIKFKYRDDWSDNQYKDIYPRIIKPINLLDYGEREKIEYNGKRYYLYWGDIHCHAKYCDGRRTADDVYLFAKNVAKLDFAAITTHDKVGKVFLDKHKWEIIQERSKNHNKPGEFVSIEGYEWDGHGNQALDSRVYGHYNVYYFGEGYKFFRVDQKEGQTIKTLWNSLRKYGYKALTIPAHPSDPNGMRCDFSFYDSEYVPAIEIYSIGGSYEKVHGDLLNMRSDNSSPAGFYVQDYLKKEYKVGFIASSDSHNGHPGWDIGSRYSFDTGNVPKDFYRGGLCAVMCDELTRESIYNAIKNRRCYATTGERIFIDFRLNDVFMGQEIRVKRGKLNVNIEFKIKGTGNIESVEIIKNGYIAATYSPRSEKEVHIVYNNEVYINRDSYYYIKVYHEGGNIAWGSPIYLSIC